MYAVGKDAFARLQGAKVDSYLASREESAQKQNENVNEEIKEIKAEMETRHTYIWDFLFKFIIVTFLQVTFYQRYHEFLKKPFV